MKYYTLLLLLSCAYAGHAQVKNNNKTRQIEQLQQLKETVSRKIDTIEVQLTAQADSIDDMRKKLNSLKREGYSQDKPDMASKEQAAKISQELFTITNLTTSLQKKIDLRQAALDKAFNLQKDLEDKINALVSGNNQ